jgi:hypothetical protein
MTPHDQGGAGYDSAFPFLWTAGTWQDAKTWNPKYFVQAVNLLTQEVQAVASSYPSNSVVDVNLIGHSRGADVVTQVSRQLANSSVPQLRDGYLELTLLDPHPANNHWPNNAQSASVGFILPLIDLLAAHRYRKAQQLLHDPPIVIPPYVAYVSDYYQHSLAWQLPPVTSQFPFIKESVLNLWGQSPDLITIENSQDTVWGNQKLLAPPVGHAEVPVWYTQHIVSELYNGPE